MNVEVYRNWFIVGSFALMLSAAAPTLALFIHLPSGSEKFSELWLLGSGHKAENYPSNVRTNENYSLYVGVENHLGSSAYYRIYVKFCNQNQSLPMVSVGLPSLLPPLYEFSFFVEEGKAWETLLNFRIKEVKSLNNSIIVSSLSIKEVTLDVNSVSVWDEERNGFYYQLLFELWLYSVTSQDLRYHNRFVGLWLNVTA